MIDRVSVVMPAFNEAMRLPDTLGALRELGVVDEIIVVDDGSADGTAEAAKGAKTRVLSRARNGGKGEALQMGVRAARGDVIVFLDADLGATARLAHALIEPVLLDTADVVIASFRADRPSGFGLAQTVARHGVRLLAGLTMESPLSGQRAFHRRVLQAVPQFAPGFGAEVAFTIDAARAGFRVIEVPVSMKHRETGRDLKGFIHRGTQLWHIGKALLPRTSSRGSMARRAREADES